MVYEQASDGPKRPLQGLPFRGPLLRALFVLPPLQTLNSSGLNSSFLPAFMDSLTRKTLTAAS